MGFPPGPGYKPTFYMPVIEPPPSGTDPEAHYDAIEVDTEVALTSTTTEGVTIRLSNSSRGQLFAMTGGMVKFVPGGDPLETPGAEPSPGEGSVALEVWGVDVTELETLSPGAPPMTRVLYLNVKAAAVRTALQASVAAIPEAALRALWQAAHGTPPPSGITAADLVTSHLNGVMLGTATVFVEGGSPIGEPAPVDSASPTAGVEFTLRSLDGAAPDQQNMSPLSHFLSMPMLGGAGWSAHPLIVALDGIPRPVDAYVQFEVWDADAKAYAALPPGIEVDLVDYNSILPNSTLLTQTTDNSGRVHFQTADISALGEDAPDIFFRARTGSRIHVGHTLPDEWETRGWQAADGSPGCYEDFTGVQIGRQDAPSVFRIGLDVHLCLCYDCPGSSTPVRAPPKVRLDVFAGSFKEAQWETDDKGEVHGVLFDVDAGDTISFHIPFSMADDSIGLPPSAVDIPTWETDEIGPDQCYRPDNVETQIGTQSTPIDVVATVDDHNVALYWLKLLRELQTFFFEITDGDWKGIEDLELHTTSVSEHPYSWPIGSVNIPPGVPGGIDFFWDRGTFVHEFAHQVLWKQADFSSAGIAWEAVFGDLARRHNTRMLSNNESALLEGWPEFIQCVFEGPTSIFGPQSTCGASFGFTPLDPFAAPNFIDVFDADCIQKGTIDPPPLNKGEAVEGAVAIAIFRVYLKFVVGAGASQIPETLSDGNITTTANWVSNSTVRGNFLRYIWEPLNDLAPLANPTSTALFDKVRQHCPTTGAGQWHDVQAELNALRTAMAVPTVTSITPASPTAGTVHPVMIQGTEFVTGVLVEIGGIPAANVAVISGTQISADSPALAAGQYDVEVTSPGGSASLAGGFRPV